MERLARYSVLAPFTFLFLGGISSAQTTIMVNVGSSGGEATGGPSLAPSVSADGRYVAFQSDASNLVAGDTNNRQDVFLRDTQAGTTIRVSVSSTGGELFGDSNLSAISADGRYVAFHFGNQNGSDVLVHDCQTGQTVLASATPSGGSGNGYSTASAISADGRYVAFISAASNLVPGDSGPDTDCFVRDMQSATTILASVNTAGVQANNNSDPYSVAISPDGRFVGFVSNASNLVSGDTNDGGDVFLRDLQSGTTTLVSVGSHSAGGTIATPTISADGRFVAFMTDAAVDPADTNATGDIYVRDLEAGIYLRASLDPLGGQATGGSRSPAISADGRYVAFETDATNLIPGDTNEVSDVMVRDLLAGLTERVSVDSGGFQGNSDSRKPSISADGSFVTFSSQASNLVPDDTNSLGDIFRHDRTCLGAISTYCAAKMNSAGCLPSAGSIGIPSQSGPDTFYVTASNVLNNKLGMMLWSLAPASSPFGGGTLCLQQPITRTPAQYSGAARPGSTAPARTPSTSARPTWCSSSLARTRRSTRSTGVGTRVSQPLTTSA